MSGSVFFVLAIVASVALGLVGWASVRFLLVEKRPRRGLKELYSDLGKTDLPYETFCDVIMALGRCYKVDPQKLRLSDSFAGNLAKLDSWILGGGEECFSDYLRTSFGDLGKTPQSIGELLLLIAAQRPSEPQRLGD